MIIKTIPKETDAELLADHHERYMINQVRELLPELVAGSIETRVFFRKTCYVTTVDLIPNNRTENSIMTFIGKNKDTVEWLIKSQAKLNGWSFLKIKSGLLPHRYRLFFKKEEAKYN